MNPLRLSFLPAFLALLIACTPPTAKPTINTAADSYAFTQGLNSQVAKDKGILVNDTLPTTYTLSIKTQPQHGVLALAQDGSFSYQHDGSTAASDSFAYTVSSSGVQSSATVSLTLEAPKPTPKAVDDGYTFTRGALSQVAKDKGVLANDTLPATYTLTVATKPQHGTLTLDSDGSFSYQHGDSEAGQDSFTYTLSSAETQLTATVTLTLQTPPPSAPTANADSYALDEGGTLNVAAAEGVLKNDTNPLNTGLKASLVQGPGHGTLQLAEDGSFSYTHDNSETTEDSFSYSISNGSSSAQATVVLTVRPVDENPKANPDGYAVNEGATLTIAAADGVLKNDSNPIAASLKVKLTASPQHGTLTLAEDGSFVYTHNHSETSQDGFNYTLSNGQGSAEATVSLTIQPIDDVPSISKLELAQTHVIPAEGKGWTGYKTKDNNLHLVGNREALVLVDIASANGRVVDAVIEAQVAGEKLGEVVLNSPATLPKTEANGPAYSSTAYWANLDKAWIKPGLELVVRANEGQKSSAKTVKVGAPSEFTMYTLPFYLFGLTEAQVPLSQTAAPDQVTQDEYFAKHPFAKLNMINHPAQKIVWPYIVVAPREGRVAQKVTYKEQQGDGYAVMSAVLNTLGAMRSANGDSPMNNQYYAPLLMANQAGNYSGPGGGLGGGDVGTGDHSYTGIFIHEAGHAYGMPHANDGYASGSYPYIGGSLKGSGWGYDWVRKEFLGTFVPTTSSRYAGCASNGFPMGRQFDEQGRCIKQDPMQSGSGDQATEYKYTLFSDFNASVVQRYLEGSTTLSNGKHSYSDGKIFPDSSSATGYSRWDTLDSAFVPVEVKTTSGGIYGLDQGLAIQRGVPVHTIVLTVSISSIQDTFTEEAGKTRLTYADTIAYEPNLTQIYPPISYMGNLRRLIDPTDAAQRASIVPNTSENYWFCLNSGCDYTLRVTFSDNTQQHIVLHGGFKGWYSYDIAAGAGNPTSGASYKVFGVNVPGNKAIKQLELLETPEVWKGFPANPKVVASRTVN